MLKEQLEECKKQLLEELEKAVMLLIEHDVEVVTAEYYLAAFLSDVSCLQRYRSIPFGDVYDTINKACINACLGR